MKGYVEWAWKQFQDQKLSKYHYRPTKYIPLEYEKEIQYTTVDTSPELTEKQKNHIKKVCGILYNGSGVDVTQLNSLNELSLRQ